MGGVSLRFVPRVLVVCGVLAALLLAATVMSLMTGEVPVTAGEVLSSLVGLGDRATDFIVLRLRLPRLLTALFVGAAFGASGAILQSITRNPLGSPEIIGLTNGAGAGAIFVMAFLHGTMVQIAFGAVVGGLIASVVVYFLAFKNGVQGYRLVLIGIGVTFLLIAVNHYQMTRSNVYDAMAAQAWLVGGLNSRTWSHVAIVGITLGALVPLIAFYGRRLSLLEMGDPAAQGLGVDVERSRGILIGASVLLAVAATAAAGPIAFVALTAPQLARKLTRATGANVLPGALMGALLLVVSDLATQRTFGVAMPVGIATGALGGVYLVWLLAHEWRKGMAR